MAAVQTPLREDVAVECTPEAEQSVSGAELVESVPARRLPSLPGTPESGSLAHYWTRSQRPWILVAVLGLIFLLAAGLVLATESKTTSQRSPVGAVTGTVVALPTGSAPRLAVRLPSASFVTLSAQHLVTSDGRVLSPADIRPGDTIVVQGNRIVDTSQTWTNLEGIVASAPDPQGNTMIVQMRQGYQIVVDFGPMTRINGAAANSTPAVLIMDADQVQVRGVFDKQIGEMTRTESVTSSESSSVAS